MNIEHLNIILRSSDTILGAGLTFYETDGRVVFDMRGPSGGVVVARICYLIPKDHNLPKIPYYSIKYLNGVDSVKEVQTLLKEAVIKFIRKLADGTFKSCDLDGGELTTEN